MGDRPVCLYCSSNIRKATRMIEPELAGYRPWDSNAVCWSKGVARFSTLAPTRETIRAVANSFGCDVLSVKVGKGESVMWFNVWDRKTYAPAFGFFCSNQCAGLFAHKAAAVGVRLKGGSAVSGE